MTSNLEKSVVAGFTTLTVLCAAVSIIEPRLGERLFKEDAFLQDLQAVLFCLSAAFFLSTFIGARNLLSDPILRYCFLLLAVIALFVAGEEISLGQRIFGFDTPEILRTTNVQGEINVHNLPGFHRIRHWAIIGFGLSGLLAPRVASGTFFGLQLNRLSGLLPASVLRLPFAITVLLGVAVELITLLHRGGLTSEDVNILRFGLSEAGEQLTAFVVATYSTGKFLAARRPHEPLHRESSDPTNSGVNPASST